MFIAYEHPLNEAIRLCLRLEALFKCWPGCIETASPLCLNHLTQLMTLTDRPDLKSKMSQALTQHVTTLAHLEYSQQVDKQKLHLLINQLNGFIETLHQQHEKFGQSLRCNDFLMAVSNLCLVPGKLHDASLPLLTFWRHQPLEQRQQQLNQWFASLQPLMHMVTLILKLTRESMQHHKLVAKNGFHQQSLKSNQLVCIWLLADSEAIPDLSISNRHLSIHFLKPSFQDRSKPITTNLHFKLSYCA